MSSKEVVVCLGPGRSGTSLAMQVLGSCGLRLSEKLVEASASNPRGAFEDSIISAGYSSIYETLGIRGGDPIPAAITNLPEITRKFSPLEEHLIENIRTSDTIWGFKDPRTSYFLPQWTRTFNRLKIVPKYVLCVRNPAHVVDSSKRNYGGQLERIEMLWRTRIAFAINYAAGDLFVVDFETWFGNQQTSLASSLCSYVGLSPPVSSIALSEVIDSSLNRSSGTAEDFSFSKASTLELYEALKNINGPLSENKGAISLAREVFEEDNQEFFDQEKLASLVNFQLRQRRNIDRNHSKTISIKNSLIEKGQSKYARVEAANKRYARKISSKNSLIEKQRLSEAELRTANILLSQKVSQTKNQTNTLHAIRNSKTYRVADTLNKAITSPGLHTIFLPFSLIKIIFSKPVSAK